MRYNIASIKQDELRLQLTLQNIADAEDKFMPFEAVVDAKFICLCHMSFKSGGECKGEYDMSKIYQ